LNGSAAAYSSIIKKMNKNSTIFLVKIIKPAVIFREKIDKLSLGETHRNGSAGGGLLYKYKLQMIIK
jgi:hypothetical protein